MELLNKLLTELGISKVKLAKYLGVSRQMVYNYLDLEDLNKWPNEKKVMLLELFDIGLNDFTEKVISDKLSNVDYPVEVEKRLNSMLKSTGEIDNFYDISSFSKNSKELFVGITSLIKETLEIGEQANNQNYDAIRYLYYLLQAMENVTEIKYILGYMAKVNNFVGVDEYVFDEDKQFLFEGILYSALNLYSSGGASKTKIADSHRRFVEEIEQKTEDKLSRTQQLFTIKEQALKELGYKDFNDINANEVLEKIVEIESRNV